MIPHRYRIHLILICVVLVILFLPHVSDPPDKQVTEQAKAAAKRFIAQVDAGDYGKSWELLASITQNDISQQDWDQQIGKIRATAGELTERQQSEISYSNAPAEDPDGKYLIISYDSKFARTEQVAETITMTLEKDGHWRVAGYHISN